MTDFQDINNLNPTPTALITGADKVPFYNTSDAKAYAMTMDQLQTWVLAGGTIDPTFDDVTADTITTTGNVGVGVTTQTWWTTARALQVGQGAVLEGRTNTNITSLGANYFINTGGTYSYITSAEASRYEQNAGVHTWNTAGSGTAGASITWSERMRLDASGNLGIGVTPNAWGGYTAMQIGGGAVYGIASRRIGFTANAFGPSFGNFTYASTNPAGRYEIDANTHQWFTAPSGTAGNAITFTQAMTLDANGNLGLGTTSMGEPLHVARGAGTTAYAIFAGGGAGAASAMMYGQDSGGNGYVWNRANALIYFATNNVTRWQINTSGHLLAGADATYDIGASGANRPRDLYLSTMTLAQNTPFYTGANIHAANAMGIGTTSAAQLGFWTNNTERMRIVSSGRVGIGTNNPQNTLHVAGGSAVIQETSAAIALWKDSTPSRAGRVMFNNVTADALEFGVFNGTSWSSPVVVKQAGQVRFTPLAAAPTTDVNDGDVYYDSGTNKLRVRAGGAWVDLH